MDKRMNFVIIVQISVLLLLFSASIANGHMESDEQNNILIESIRVLGSSVQRTLTISSTSGGSVITPGEGIFQYDDGSKVMIEAASDTYYYFVGWTGTAVDAGKVVDPGSASTKVTVDADYRLQANFAHIPPSAYFTYSPEKPMVGGIIEFDASDSEGEILEYRWDWGDWTSETHSQPIAEHKFKKPEIYTVRLTVTDNEGCISTTDKDVNLALENGDLLLCGSEDSWFPVGLWTHVGIYDKKMNVVIEARPPLGVGFFPLSDWFYPNLTCVEVLRVETDQPTRDAAVDFAWTQIGCPFDLFNLLHCEKLSDNFDGLGWYCSELVWAAYLNTSSGKVNILDKSFYTSTTPMEIDLDDDTVVIGEHKEFIPQKPYWSILWGEAECPVDLVITDPNGLMLTKETSGIQKAIYSEVDVNNDGELYDLFAIQRPKVGTYLIQVIPESNALPTDTYSLQVAINDEIAVLAKDIQIRDIPAAPYEFVVVPPPSPSDSECLSEALDVTLDFVTGGSSAWFYQTLMFYYDGDAAQSGVISNNEDSWIQTTVSGRGVLKFYWKVSSEARFDFLEFYIDGVRQNRISGSVDWHEKTYTIPSGLHELKWRYVKDPYMASGSDCGWVDKVEWTTGP